MALIAMWLQGLESALPAPGVESRVYFAIDTGRIFVDSGSAWVRNNLVHRGTYAGGTTYHDKDLVSYNGDVWRALVDVTGVTPAEGASWTIFVAKGATGAAGSGLLSIDGVSNNGGNVDLVAGANMTITPDDTANTITLASAGGSAPDASETVKGIAEIATQTETNTGTDDTRIVTPLKLAGRWASTTLAGVVELATDTETTTGTDTSRATTPANVKAALDARFVSGGTPELIVAANDAPTAVKSAANYTCNGSNDAAQLQAAVNAAKTANGTVKLSNGTFALGTTTLWLTDTGASGGNPAQVSIKGMGKYRTTVTYSGSGTAISTGLGTSGEAGITLEDFLLDGTASTGSSRGIYIKRDFTGGRINGMRVNAFKGVGIHLLRCYGFNIRSTDVRDNTGWGIWFDAANASVVGPGVRVMDGGSDLTGGGIWVHFYDTGSLTGLRDEYTTNSASGSIIDGSIERNDNTGILIDRTSTFKVSGLYMEDNAPASLTNAATDAQIRVTGDPTGDASHPTNNVLIQSVRFNGNAGVNNPAPRALYVSGANVQFDACETFNHATSITKCSSNGSIKYGALAIRETGITKFDDFGVATQFYGQVQRIVLQFKIVAAANITAGEVKLSDFTEGANGRSVLPLDWEVTAMTVRGSAARTAGSITFFPIRSGTSLQSSLSCTIDATNDTFNSAFGRATGNAGTSCGLQYNSTSIYAPTTTTYFVQLFLTMKNY